MNMCDGTFGPIFVSWRLAKLATIIRCREDLEFCRMITNREESLANLAALPDADSVSAFNRSLTDMWKTVKYESMSSGPPYLIRCMDAIEDE